MRMIDADELECDTGFDVIERDYIAVSKRQIDDAPTVEAIPVEQVAELLTKYAGSPCNYTRIIEEIEFCEERSCRDSKVECWLHALREGWLDEE